MKLWGFIRPEPGIVDNFDEPTRNLAGKKVMIFLETSVFKKGHGIRVDVMPSDLSNSSPTPMLLKNIRTDDQTKKIVEQFAYNNGKSL